MERWNSMNTGIAQGDVQLFADYIDDGPMWAESGDREYRREISFGERFKSAPTVQVGVSLLDIDHSANTRYEIVAENVTAKGFEIVFRTWSDTRVARVRASWMAIGETPNHDDWDID